MAGSLQLPNSTFSLRNLSMDSTQRVESDTCNSSALCALNNNVNMSCTLCSRLYEPDCSPIPSETDDPSLFDLASSAQNGCKGCFLIKQAAWAFQQLWANFDDAEVRVFICPPSRPSTWGSDGQFHLTLSHQTRGTNNLWEKITIHVAPGELSPYPAVRAQTCLEANSGSEESLRRLKILVDECQTHHTQCKVPSDTLLPDRLVQVQLLGGSHLLRVVDSKGKTGQYTALSHCWGQSGTVPPVKCTKASLKSQQDSIPWDSLSKTLQDAVTITRALGIQYLWIDSLCIIQDDKDDWREQASQMARIYSSSAVTIVATRASHGVGGCFSHRTRERPVFTLANETAQATFYARSMCSITHHALYTADMPPMSEYSNLRNFPLYERAWCLQERLLSSRCIEYGAQELVWQCNESFNCECDGQRPAFTRVNLNIKHQRAKHSRSIRERNEVWLIILESYTATKLTKENDILPALSGIVSKLQDLGFGRYLAGLWEEDLLQWLLWYSETPGKRPSSYMAPTWSWASRIGPICMWHLGDNLRRKDDFGAKPLVDILEVESETRDNNPFGETLGGFLRLSGRIVTLKLHNQEDGAAGYRILETDVEIQIKMDTLEDETSDLPVSYLFTPLVTTYTSGTSMQIIALLIENLREGVHRRIGYLRTLHVVEISLLERFPIQDFTII